MTVPTRSVRAITRQTTVAFFLILNFVSQAASDEARWWKGNLHTHTFWSDGDDFPEMVVDWYKNHGYNFLSLSDHNILQAGEKWTTIPASGTRRDAFKEYVGRFGTNWIECLTEKGETKVRLKTFEQFHGLFEEKNKFLLMLGEEISDRFREPVRVEVREGKEIVTRIRTNSHPIHLNATNLRELIRPQGGISVADVIQRNVDAVLEQRKKTRQPMIPHINHPNFGWALTAEDIMRVQGDKFFEIYNGHPVVRNYGDDLHASTERIWDILLAFRLAELNLPPIWGTGVDDAHAYHVFNSSKSNPGRGWIMVRARKLTPEALIAAMEAGDFYASSGVVLKDVKRVRKTLSLEIDAEENVTYKIQFIGTRKNFKRESDPVRGKEGKVVDTTRRYSDEIGTVLQQTGGTSASYTLKGDEIYVRAKIISSKRKANPYEKGDREMAWTQPLIAK
jgi:hypothetical protein